MSDLFISYNWESKQIVHKIADLLRSNGYKVWLDVNAMNAGDILHGEIKKGIENCKLFIAFITRKYCDSKNCQLEIKYAFEQKKRCIYVMVDENLGDDPGGIKLLVAGELRLNAFEHVNHKDWPVNLYEILSKDVFKHLNEKEMPKLIDLEKLILCVKCNKKFNLEDKNADNCRKPMQMSCNKVLCLKCIKDKKVTSTLGNEENFECPFEGVQHPLKDCRDLGRLHNIIRYFETKERFNILKDNKNNYEDSQKRATNEIINGVDESKRRIKEHVQEIIKELNNYLSKMIEKLDGYVEKWRAEQLKIKNNLKIDEMMKSTENSINELEENLKKIEITVNRNSGNLIDEHLKENATQIESINDEIRRLNNQIKQESDRLKEEMSLSYRRGSKQNDFAQIIGVLEEQKLTLNETFTSFSQNEEQISEIHCEIHNDEMENKIKDLEKMKHELLSSVKCLYSRIKTVNKPEIVELCKTTGNLYFMYLF